MRCICSRAGRGPQAGLSGLVSGLLAGLVIGQVAACGGGRGVSGSPVSAAPAPPAEASAGPAAPEPPVAVALGDGPPAWLETPPQKPYDDGDADPPLAEPEDVAVGTAAALVRGSRGHLFVVDAARGYAATVRPPDAPTWLGVDLRDRLYAATADGALWWTGAGAAEFGFTPLAVVPGAIAWDAVDLIVATDGAQVHVSADGGRHFRASRPSRASGSRIARVQTRADGLVIAVGETAKGPAAWISRDRGRRWTISAYQPATLVRAGASIWNGDFDCPATLSADGASWVRDAPESGAGWSGMMQISDEVSATPRDFQRGNALVPAAPPPPPRGEALTGLAACTPGEGSGHGYGTMRGLSCDGVGCLRGHVDTVIAETRTTAGLLRDAMCDRADPAVPFRCAPGATLLRRPHAAVQDRDAGSVTIVGRLPDACGVPLAMQSVRGIGFLTCRGADLERDGVAVFALDREGGWHAEGSLPAAAATVWAPTLADDGTLMLHASCPKGSPCVAFVRRPDEPGSASAWWTAAVPEALGYRVVPGGALAIAEVGDGGAGSALRLVRLADGKATTLVERAPIDGDVTSVRIDAAGRVVLGLHDGDERRFVWVRPDGSLVAGAGGPVGRVGPSGEIQGEVMPVDPAIFRDK